MKAYEFITEKKRKRRPRWAAYGPGPYGGYGYAVGYSGDGGASGGDGGGVGEASYPGNLGMMELAKFFQTADNKQKSLFQELLQQGKKGLAWKLVQDTVNVKLQGKEFEEDLVTELKISDNDVKRIIKDRLAIDAETGIDAMKLAIDQMSNISKTSYVQSQASQLMMLYRQADMKIGGDYYRKLIKLTEDQHPNEKPRGPETKPTMPKGTVKVDVSDVYDWYKLGQHISDLKGLGKHDFGKGPPSAILSFGSEDEEHEYIKNLKKTGLDTTDIDPKSHEKKKGQKTDKTYNVGENFADGKKPGRKGLAKRSGVNCKSSVTSLRKTAKNSSGEKARMAHWCANMKSGRNK